MPRYYDNIDITINGSGICAESAQLGSSNSIAPFYSIGKRGDMGEHAQGPVLSEFKYSYYPEIGNDPNIGIVNLLKSLNDDVTWSGVNVELAGITGYMGYLTNFSIKASPNEITRADVTYRSFRELSGTLQDKRTAVTYNNSGLFLHGWTSYVVSRNGHLTYPTYSFEYNCSFDWQPIYILGRKDPETVHLMGGRESLSFLKDVWYNNVTFSGAEPHDSFISYDGSDTSVDIMAYKLLCQVPAASGNDYSFTITGSKIRTNKTEIKTDGFVTVLFECENYF